MTKEPKILHRSCSLRVPFSSVFYHRLTGMLYLSLDKGTFCACIRKGDLSHEEIQWKWRKFVLLRVFFIFAQFLKEQNFEIGQGINCDSANILTLTIRYTGYYMSARSKMNCPICWVLRKIR